MLRVEPSKTRITPAAYTARQQGTISRGRHGYNNRILRCSINDALAIHRVHPRVSSCRRRTRTLDSVLILGGVMTTHVSKRRAGKAHSLLKRTTVSFLLYLGVPSMMLLAQMLCRWYRAANVARESQRGESDTGRGRAISKVIVVFAILTANTRQYCRGQAVVGSV